jgi:hypothetical protein
MKSKISIKHRELFIEAQKLGLAALREHARIWHRPPRWSRSDVEWAKSDWWRWPAWFENPAVACAILQITSSEDAMLMQY